MSERHARFHEGLRLYQQGRLGEAERVCEDIVRQQPAQFDALHLLGVIALRTGRHQRGVELIAKAIAVNGAVADVHCNLGNGLRALNRHAEAVASYDRAIALQPDHADAWYSRGNALRSLKRHAEAIASYDKAIALKPDHAAAYYNRGNGLRDLGRHADAVASYDAAIALQPDHAEAHANRGTALGVLRRHAEALASHDQAIALRPEWAEAHYNRGIALHELGRQEAAVASYDRAIALRPAFAAAYAARGAALQAINRYADAVASYGQAIALKPDLAAAQSGCGHALWRLQRWAEALACYDQALRLKPDDADAHIGRGAALRDLGRQEDALASFDRAIALRPGFADAHNNRAIALRDLGRHEEAVASCDRAIALRPDFAEAYVNRGLGLCDLARYADAVASFDAAIALQPEDATACYGRGIALSGLERHLDAVASYDKAIALRPDDAAAFNNRGMVLQTLGRDDDAIASFRTATALRPDLAEPHLNLGAALCRQGRLDEMTAHHERELSRNPDLAELRFQLCTARLPVLYMTEAEIDERRAAYRARLQELYDYAGRCGDLGALARAVGSTQPFFLAYQGRNDRDLQGLYGALVCRIMAAHDPVPDLPPPPGPRARVRVGIVSGFFRRHSNWKIPIKGWVSQLDRRKFEVFGYHTGSVQDDETEVAAGLCDRFVRGALSAGRWRATILADKPHVLIYPEVGMDPVSAWLAAQRLAAVQCTSWGHPTTSGYPTLDYYLSAARMEPPDGQSHYTERLIRLPNLSIYYEPPALPPPAGTRAEFGLRPSATVYWCAQSLMKYLPQHDEVFPRIAQDVGDCQFVFIEYARSDAVSERFQKRLDQAFAARGLKARDHCVMLPRLGQDRFVAAIGQCDVVLDSIGWSGCNSTLEGLAHDVPIVTMQGPLMRGRHTAAILAMMGVTDTVVDDSDAYVATAVRLARDDAWRRSLGRQIAANRHRVYRDRPCISALEDFLDRAARGDIVATGPSPG